MQKIKNALRYLLVAVGVTWGVGAIVGSVLVSLPAGCSGEIEPKSAPMRDGQPVASTVDVDAPAIQGAEQSSQALSNGSFFGASGFGTNFECKSYGCYCDPAPGSGMGGMTTDCKDMQKAGVCDPGSTLVCGATTSRAICQCIKKQAPATCPATECPLSSNALPSGYNGDGQNAFYRLPDSDRSCWVPWNLVPYGTFVQTRTGEKLASLIASYSGQQCTPEEQRGSVVMTSGYYQTPDTLVHFKVNRRSCQITLAQWNARRFTPSLTQQDFGQAGDHRSYLWCSDTELRAGGFLN